MIFLYFNEKNKKKFLFQAHTLFQNHKNKRYIGPCLDFVYEKAPFFLFLLDYTVSAGIIVLLIDECAILVKNFVNSVSVRSQISDVLTILCSIVLSITLICLKSDKYCIFISTACNLSERFKDPPELIFAQLMEPKNPILCKQITECVNKYRNAHGRKPEDLVKLEQEITKKAEGYIIVKTSKKISITEYSSLFKSINQDLELLKAERRYYNSETQAIEPEKFLFGSIFEKVASVAFERLGGFSELIKLLLLSKNLDDPEKKEKEFYLSKKLGPHLQQRILGLLCGVSGEKAELQILEKLKEEQKNIHTICDRAGKKRKVRDKSCILT